MENRPRTYTITSATIKSETEYELVIAPFSPPWFTMLARAAIFGFLGVVVILVAGQGALLIGLIALLLAFVFIGTLPLNIKAVFDFVARQMTFEANYLLRNPRYIELQIPFSQIARLGFFSSDRDKRRFVDVHTVDGIKITLDFGSRKGDAEKLVSRFSSVTGTVEAPTLNSPETVMAVDLAEAQALMQRELRSWTIWLLVLGVLQMITAGGFSSWGVLLIVVGLASLYFRESAMFGVYAVTVAWAGLSNLLYSETGAWNVFAFFQFYLTFIIFKQFRRFQKAEREAKAQAISEDSPKTTSRAEMLFPWLSAILGVGALGGYGLFWVGIFARALLHVPDAQDGLVLSILSALATIAVYAGILALAMGLSGWGAAFERKWASILGTITGGITLMLSLVISLLLNVFQ